MEVRELRPGLWRWTAQHPDWTPDEGGPDGWEQDVGCVYYEGPECVCLIDPLVPPEPDRERFLSALDRDVERAARPVAVLLTVFWHERSAIQLAERYGASVWKRDSASEPPRGVGTFPVERSDETLLWLPEHGALVAGDVLLGAGGGGVRVCPDSWLPEKMRGRVIRDALRPLLELPVEMVLVSHGEPVVEDARAALAHALETDQAAPQAPRAR